MKETLDLRGLNFEEGYIAVIDKPLSWTSTDVVRKIKSALRRLGYRKIKVGHAGTLDPLATGVLLVCIGRATKMVDALQAEEKEYVADVMLGATTPSYDLEHPVDATFPTQHITRGKVLEALAALSGERNAARRVRPAAHPHPRTMQQGHLHPFAGPRNRAGARKRRAPDFPLPDAQRRLQGRKRPQPR